MTRSLLLLAALLTTTAHAAPHVRRRLDGDQFNALMDEDEDVNELGRIVNGTMASPGQYPWYVLMESGACGGTLISPNRVLTSATCILNQNPKTVWVGASTTSDGVQMEVLCANLHPDYYRTGNSIFNDVAVIKLKNPIAGVTAVNLNSNINYPPFLNQSVTTMGFGFTDNAGPLSGTLQSASTQLFSTFMCQENFPEMTIFGSQHLCALDPGVGVCTGDSGGPLMDSTASTATQIGITSFTFGSCGSATYPDIYVNIASYIGWIRSQIASDFCDAFGASFSPSAVPSSAPSATVPTPAPTPAPTKKEECFLDKLKDLVEDVLPYTGLSSYGSGGESEEMEAVEGEAEEEQEEQSGGWWKWVQSWLPGGDEQANKKGGKGGKQKEEKAEKEKKEKGGKGQQDQNSDGTVVYQPAP